MSVFSEKYPDVKVTMFGGSHEDLYDALQSESADIVINDQRRAFSDEYVNLSLARERCYAEIAARNPISALEKVTPSELKNTPCVLIASPKRQKTEREYFGDIFGFRGDFLFADNVDEAQLMVVQNNGFMPTTDNSATVGNTTVKIPLYRSGRPVTQHYCAFWKTDNSGYYIEDFAEILKNVFSRQSG